MKVLYFDTYNMLHRARYGFATGEFNVVFNFFRGIKPLIEKFKPDKVYFVLEGNPHFRYDAYPEYKANRIRDDNDEYKDFIKQRNIIFDVLKHISCTVIAHDDFECDDLISSLIKQRHCEDSNVIITSDTDFTQIADIAEVYSPVKKEFILKTEYDYILWKSLIGDSADNIKGVPGIGKKKVFSVLDDLELWKSKNKHHVDVLERNLKLIKFAEVDLQYVHETEYKNNFSALKQKFSDMSFDSIIKDGSWQKYIGAFYNL